MSICTATHCKNHSQGKYKYCKSCRDRSRSKRSSQIARWKDLGLCSNCGKEKEDTNFSCCSSCRERDSARTKARAEKSRSGTICMGCFKEESLPSLLELKKNPKCESCYVKKIAKSNGFLTSDGELLLNKLRKQNFICPYTGDRLVLGLNSSLDHIKPKSRFPELINDINNVEWVTLEVNIMKRDRTKKEFLDLIDKIRGHN